MATPTKKDKTAKQRRDKYAEKVSINTDFDSVLRIFSDAAHEKNSEKRKAAKRESDKRI